MICVKSLQRGGSHEILQAGHYSSLANSTILGGGVTIGASTVAGGCFIGGKTTVHNIVNNCRAEASRRN